MRLSRHEIANPVYISDTRRNPLIPAGIAIKDRPYIIAIKTPDDFEIFPECFKTMAAPDIVVSVGMAIRLEVFIKRVFVESAQRFHDLFLRLAVDELA